MKLKNFTERVNLNVVFSKTLSYNGHLSDISPLSYMLRKSYYQMLKNLKLHKGVQEPLQFSDLSLGSKLQTNNFYLSLMESLKKERVKSLKRKMKFFQNQKEFLESFQDRGFFVVTQNGKKLKKKNFKGLSEGLEKFDKCYGFSSKGLNKRQILLEKLKTKNFESRVLFSRFFLYTSDKKQKKNFLYLYKRKRKLNSLLNVFSLSFLKYKSLTVQRKLLVKRFVWKMKKGKKWQNFRFRQGFTKDFYIPSHLEINYKTLGFVYLGYTDFKTVSAKIPFWLNLRRLLTYMIK